MKYEHLLAIALFTCSVAAYTILFILGRKWRKEFESEGITYWKAPKEERVRELMQDVWHPKLISLFYGLAYFANGYMKISFSMWASLFLLQVRKIGTFETALFLGLIYTSWQWKMFMGIISDKFPIKFRGKKYRRHPWFIITGILSLLAIIMFLRMDTLNVPVWTVFFPIILAMTTAGAIFDMAADSYILDAVPPDYHGRVVGGVSLTGQSLGGIVAATLGPFLIKWGGYNLIFISGGITGLFSLLFLFLKEPTLEHERVFNKKAIAFSFTEKTVFLASILNFSAALGTNKIANPMGGMFSLIMNEIVGGFTPTQAGNMVLITLLIGIPASILGGLASDKLGHKRIYLISGVGMVIIGYAWMILKPGMTVVFMILAIISNFIQRINLGGRFALMADSTPLALSATIYQMYMSVSWIGNVPCSIIIGLLLSKDIPLLFFILSSFNLIPIILCRNIEVYDAAKASKL